MNSIKNTLLLIGFMISFASVLLSQSNYTTLYFDFDACTAYNDGSNADYSEFTALKSKCDNCSDLNLIGGSLYRDEPAVNRHSCTPGYQGGEAMCVSSLDMCNYMAGHQKSVKFSIELVPGTSGIASLDGISFYEKAPVSFDWIDGTSGPNNYPTKYSLRVLVDGQELYKQIDNDTNTDWTLQDFDFSTDPAFEVSTSTVFDFELLAYCLIGNSSLVNAWDLDELKIFASCDEISGGTLSGGPFEFCVGDGLDDIIDDSNIDLTGNSGGNSQLVITDIDGNILGLPGSVSDVNFDGAGAGVCLIWNLSFEGTIDGAAVGNNAADLVGCYSLSNPLEVVRSQPEGGELSGGPFEFCVGDDIEDVIADSEITLTGNAGANTQWVITDEDGNILGLPGSVSDVNFDGAGAGVCLIWNLSFEGTIDGAAVGNNAADLVGCYSLSNPLEVVRNQPEGGELTGGPFEFCVGDDIEDVIADSEISLTGNAGANTQLVITDIDGNILGLPGSVSDVNFDGAGAGVCLIWNLSYDGQLDGAAMGNNAADLVGCYSLSNPLEVVRSQPEGGELTGGPFEFCVGDDIEDVIADSEITLSGNAGANMQWVITDEDGNILGLPGSVSDVNFDGAGAGVCLIWNLSYDGQLDGAAMGNNAADLVGCYSLSNPLEVVRSQPEGGELSGGPFEFCVGDDIEDVIADSEITLSGNAGANTQWVITDIDGNILGLPGSVSDVNFDGAGAGVCLIWNLSYDGQLDGAAMGNNAVDLVGCYSLSNPLEVVRNQPEGGELVGGPFEFCVGDDIEDVIADSEISLSGNAGANTQLVITDIDGNILGLPGSVSDVNFDGAGAGVCLIWNLSYDGQLDGAAMGNNAADLVGCYSLSNPLEVVRNQPEGGELVGGPFEFCVGDDIEDVIADSEISLSGNAGANTQLVITDIDGNILGLPGSISDVNFDGAGAGVCLIWNLSYDGQLDGAAMGNNAADLVGCYSLSNPLEVVRSQPEGGELSGGPFEFCVGDGLEDVIADSEITLSGNAGANTQWVITDEDGSILGLPGSVSDVNFDGAGAGVCLIWNLSYDGQLDGAAMGNNAADLVGCYSLSNPLEVVRSQPEGGELTGGPFEFCVGDDIEDVIADSEISLSGNAGANTQWVITDEDGNILGLPGSVSDVNFDGAGAGVCLIWNLSYDGQLDGAAMGNNAADLVGCYSLSNPLEVVRSQPEGGELTGGPFEFCVGDDIEDVIADSEITLSGNAGANTQWVITDEDGNILGLPGSISDVNFDGAGAGVCLIWNLSYDGQLDGAAMGNNAADLVGCYSLSNPLEVVRSQPEGGELSGGPFEFCVGDDIEDVIADSEITLSGNAGANTQWVITDEDGNILGLPGSVSDVNFDGAGAGVCLIWNLSYDGQLDGAAMGNNAADLVGCYSLSNPLEVVRSQPEGGELSGGPFEFCVGDGLEDVISDNEITLTGNAGANTQWVITDEDGNILGLPGSISDVNFDGAGAGVCLIWNLSYDGQLDGAAMGNNAADLVGCYSLSNPLEVVRSQPEGGELTGGPFEFCVGDDIEDVIADSEISLSGNAGANTQWVITDEDGNILGLPGSVSDVNFDGAGAGVCLIWNLSYDGQLDGAAMGNNAADLVGCYSLSNPLEVVRLESGVACNTMIHDNQEVARTIKLFPNPVSDVINIYFKDFESGEINIQLFDLRGNEIINMISEIKDQDQIIVNASGFSSGVYYMRIIQNKRVVSMEKIVIENN